MTIDHDGVVEARTTVDGESGYDHGEMVEDDLGTKDDGNMTTVEDIPMDVIPKTVEPKKLRMINDVLLEPKKVEAKPNDGRRGPNVL